MPEPESKREVDNTAYNDVEVFAVPPPQPGAGIASSVHSSQQYRGSFAPAAASYRTSQQSYSTNGSNQPFAVPYGVESTPPGSPMRYASPPPLHDPYAHARLSAAPSLAPSYASNPGSMYTPALPDLAYAPYAAPGAQGSRASAQSFSSLVYTRPGYGSGVGGLPLPPPSQPTSSPLAAQSPPGSPRSAQASGYAYSPSPLAAGMSPLDPYPPQLASAGYAPAQINTTQAESYEMQPPRARAPLPTTPEVAPATPTPTTATARAPATLAAPTPTRPTNSIYGGVEEPEHTPSPVPSIPPVYSP